MNITDILPRGINDKITRDTIRSASRLLDQFCLLLCLSPLNLNIRGLIVRPSRHILALVSGYRLGLKII